ncbi:DNA polymerase III subunit delta [soil metagenome]
MPPTKKKAAKKKAAPKNPLPNLVAVVGSDEGAVKERALALSAELTPEGGDEFSVDIIDGVAENADHASRICASTLQALQTLPFFGGEKLVWLKNLNFAANTQTGRAQASLEGLEMLAEYLKSGSLGLDIRFLISAPDIDKVRSFFLTLKKFARLEVFDKAAGSEDWERAVLPFVSARAKSLGLHFSPDLLEHFVHAAGDDTRIAANELEKLDLYLGARREVTSDDIAAIVSLGRGGVIFEIGNAIGHRDLARAIDRVDHFLFRGESAIGILLGGIVPKVRSLLIARDLLERLKIPPGGSYNSFLSKASRHPEHKIAHLPRTKDGTKLNLYPVFLASNEARQFTLAELRHGLEACLTANFALVQSSLDHQLVLHRLLGKLLASGKRRPR